ncbi:XdhC family protein [Catenovulum sp. 2E275]|uniref:XdhC family protein n=1 Tax=Catenovulum sp. 2E275 TaxID=2980497 RepID=UPI0021D28A47|nr:XdhC/CoxI family protein [Catenovulum sp. 2E275]MCU4674080.1 XdhC family protein [Catenovulum sp. 2E275]
MSNALNTILATWYPLKDATDWVLGTIYQTEGPAYRKAGAMMLFSGDGQQLGMLSGGCLESDISRHARQVMLNQKSKLLTYDGSDEDDMAFQLGIGCGGIVHIMLQPICQQNNYLRLDKLLHNLTQNKGGIYYQLVANNHPLDINQAELLETDVQQSKIDRNSVSELIKQDNQTWLKTHILPAVHLLIAGGGIDARPVCTMAKQLGWRVSIWDPRPANARAEYFATADHLLKFEPVNLSDYIQNNSVNAVIVMSHNVSLDALVLKALSQCQTEFIGLLGPINRRDKVLKQAEIKLTDLPVSLNAPVGLNIGGQLPESIALSALSQCHSVLYQKSAHIPKQQSDANYAVNCLKLAI